MITVVYDTRTGLGKKFAEKLDCPIQSVADGINNPCILVTRCVGYGKIPRTTKKFLKKYGAYVKGVVVNGDKRFGKHFCGAGPKIEAEYGQTIILNIEGEGNDSNAEQVKQYITSIGK